MDGNPARSVKAPPYDPSTLPPLPQKRSKDKDNPALLKSTYSSSAIMAAKKQNLLPAVPPRLPVRRSETMVEDTKVGLNAWRFHSCRHEGSIIIICEERTFA
jgi:hypothetical protein